MKEIRGNLWDYWTALDTAVVITTNGTVKKNSECVMGKGCAFEAAQKIPGIAKTLGHLIEEKGNHVYYMGHGIFSFPVKHNWWEPADLSLIKRSAYELVELANTLSLKSVIIPRPGCGNGWLRWNDVKAVLEKIFDDRFAVISFQK